MKRITTACFAVLAFCAGARAQWNLPYQRPAKYDYGSYYGATLAAGLQSDPTFFSAALKRGWGYYKQTFIMSNGLVCHRRKQNGQVIGMKPDRRRFASIQPTKYLGNQSLDRE